jgi:speckle-type POZ protein
MSTSKSAAVNSPLVTRSKYFAAMFQHPTKEQSTDQIKIEDIEPQVFQELLRFIYTGRVPLDKLETMAAGLFIAFAAENYLIDELKMKCENYLLLHMTPDNCVILLLHGDLNNPAEYMKKAAKFFRRYRRIVIDEKKLKFRKRFLIQCRFQNPDTVP